MQHGEREKDGAATQKSGFEQHHGKRRGSMLRFDSQNMPSDSREWQAGTSTELPRTSGSTTLSRSLTPLQCLMGDASCFSPAGDDDTKADMLSFGQAEP